MWFWNFRNLFKRKQEMEARSEVYDDIKKWSESRQKLEWRKYDTQRACRCLWMESRLIKLSNEPKNVEFWVRIKKLWAWEGRRSKLGGIRYNIIRSNSYKDSMNVLVVGDMTKKFTSSCTNENFHQHVDGVAIQQVCQILPFQSILMYLYWIIN